ncbi:MULTISPECIES: hypothetical protein [Bacillus cereus group]|uniref:hypothetical protein n=1 Tax=Bacillus cereus group TaxID=86661 RepID=UPI0007FB366E|nr:MULTISPECIES: hypothetical protein [Bacillus cereus group]MCP1398624.1 hypothetical protein [Bacillus cereus]MEC2259214.1 hypothetical protein [Bacillus cereus]OBW88377.1 hypothetical protein A9L49_13050 [Bacillus cereus]PER51538.1 hypothetical protein CN486_26800 [Bacillus thuringiensis]PES48710.1 hypothetical protein CN499_16705 [Bacillus thuringiensis]
MDNLTIQGNTYDLSIINKLIDVGIVEATTKEAEIYKQFRGDIYTTYKQIRHICNPRACEKTTLETVKKSLREHWLEHYLNMLLTEAHIVIEYAELFFGLAIK